MQVLLLLLLPKRKSLLRAMTANSSSIRVSVMENRDRIGMFRMCINGEVR